MFTSAVRAAPRRIMPSRILLKNNPSRRFLSTAPPSQKSRSWKSGATRWALAAGGVYYYNTSNIFAEEPEAAIQAVEESIHHAQESPLPTVDGIIEEKKKKYIEQRELDKAKTRAEGQGEEEGESEEGDEGADGIKGLEEEADQQGAFNPETGEINWDCPCLGGMAHGPCGEEFKEAFSCFVYSTEEVKGVECIPKFKGMQDCFRAHPEMYGPELEDEEDEVEDELRAREQASANGSESEALTPTTIRETPKSTQEAPGTATKAAKENKRVEAPKSADAHKETVPKAAHDATTSN
ncbi:hypothetical protein HYFRA_00004846 [Hymenoscyphus fraxineus]|uniref:Mitochondrial intermembrane space import and assembly protein 40 n=1 Tax=Hymenoscyphus fraxineus TaxID=746836 RepID=A0A9N9PP98_9HELO|nr:hypothetical protein HYFRA_00004846 [Hymenoscyphus fraxineus]